MIAGRFICLVGPFGVGKDTVMADLAAHDARLQLVRRVITRPSDAGSEAFDSLYHSTFATKVRNGEFALHWQAHGLSYGSQRTVNHTVAVGPDLLSNLSRSKLAAAQSQLASPHVIVLSADQDILQTRLNFRGPETIDDSSIRPKRAQFELPLKVAATHIDNSVSLEDTITGALDALYGLRG